MSAAPARSRSPSQPLATRQELHGARVPKQLRSVEVLHRIALAGRSLLLEREYEAVSVADIAARAGVSVGTFYVRFPSKEHLVVFLVAELADELRERIAAELAPGKWSQAAIGDIIRHYLSTMGSAFLHYRGLLRPATMIARQTRDAELTALLSGFNDAVHGQLRALLLEHRREISHAQPAMAINVAILMISAAMREVLLYGEPVSRLAPSHVLLLDELAAAVVSYFTH